jgi:hypothetical protein
MVDPQIADPADDKSFIELILPMVDLSDNCPCDSTG